MGRRRSEKRKRATAEQQHVDGGILRLLYPTSRLCTLHDLLVSLLLPSLQQRLALTSSRTIANQLEPQTADAAVRHVVNQDAGQTMRANADLLQAAMFTNTSMRQAAVSAHMGSKFESLVAAENVDMCMQQAGIAGDMGAHMDMQHSCMQVTMGANMGFAQATIAMDVGAPQVHASKKAMYVDAYEVVTTMPTKNTAANAYLSKQQQVTLTTPDKAAITAAAHSLLVREGDPADYLHLLLHGYGVLSDAAPTLGHTILEQRWTHQQVIERAIQILFKQGKNSSNVLCFGFQQPRPRSCLKRDKTAPAGLACVSDNAAVTVLNSQTWKTIHARVGDSIMLHLLSHADIFQPIPHTCYVQVAGTSVLLSSQQNKSSEQGAVGATKIVTDRWKASWRKQKGERSQVTESGEGLDGIGAHVNVQSRHCATDVSTHHQVTTRKRQRPHSWQRRKARRLYDKQAEQENGFNVTKERKICMQPIEQEIVMRAPEMHLSNLLEIGEGCLATQEKACLGAEDMKQEDAHTNDMSQDNRQLLTLEEFSPFEKMKHDSRNIPLLGLSSQPCSATTIYEQSNVYNQDRKKQKKDGFSTRSSIENLAYGTHQEQVSKVSKRGKLQRRLASSFIINGNHGNHANRGGGRRLINRTRMFYKAKFPYRAGLPKNHLLQRLKCSHKDATILLEAIFGKESICKTRSSGACHVPHSKTCCNCIFCLLKQLISNAQRCQYSLLLKRHCPSCPSSCMWIKKSAKDFKVEMKVKNHVNLDILKGGSDGPSNHTVSLQGLCKIPAEESLGGIRKVPLKEENSSFCTHSQVVAFVWAVCRQIVPEELLGSRKNWRNLRRNIFAFVSLRRHESFSLEQCMFRLKLRGYRWCQEHHLGGCSFSKEVAGRSILPKKIEDDSKDNPHHFSARGDHKETSRSFQILKRTLLESWIYWFFSGLIVPIIQAHFYVTESEKYKQNVLFYRKSVWAKIKGNAVKEMMKCNFKRLGVQSTVNLLKQGSLGYSHARLLPKKAGVRLIANLGGYSAIPITNTCGEVGRVSKRWGKHENSTKSHARKSSMAKIPRDKKSLIFKPINLVLRDLHYCLKYEQEKHAEDLGCSVFDYNDVYLKLLPYIIGHKRASNTATPLYLVVCDVLQAFDTVKQEKLVEIVQDFVREEEYCVMQYGYASPCMDSIKVFHERSAMSTVNGMTSLDIILQLAAKQRNAVCIDQAYAVKVKRSHIFGVLEEHILRNIIQIGQHFYLQVVGIPQGSILSSLLCSLYYGHLEKSRLSGILHLEHMLNSSKQMSKGTNMALKASWSLRRKDFMSANLEPIFIARSLKFYLVNGSVDISKSLFAQSSGTCRQYTPLPSSFELLEKAAVTTEEVQHRNILLRLVDDWLFVSNSHDDALAFIRKMHRGFIDYNCVANRLKTAVSFDAVLGGSTLNMNVFRTQDGACYMRWSGLLINCNTLEVQADYTRYCGVEVQATLTVWRKNNPGYYLMTKLCQFMRPKCHPIFYDANINSPATVFLNAYQAFLLCAMKFHAYNCSLPCGGRCNPEFGFRAVQKSARYMHFLLAHRTNKISKSSEIKPLLLLHAKEMQWLALRAFHKVLLRKQSRYVRLLYLIKTELQLPKYIGLGESPLMLSALNPRRSSMFEDIIY